MPFQPKRQNLIIENAHIFSRNFSGKKTDYSEEGDRYFCVRLDPDIALALKEQGWNVKFSKPRPNADPVDAPLPFLPVTVSYAKRAPTTVLITKKNKTHLGIDDIHIFDFAEIINADVEIYPSYWEKQGRSGLKAYLVAAYITIKEDAFAEKYRNIPDAAVNNLEDSADYGDEA